MPARYTHCIFADGRLAEDAYWFNPDFRGDLELFKNSADWSAIEEDRRKAVKNISRLEYHM